ncbi:MAG: ABC transporter ATP-binding protein [Lachnospiraceae bacterium]|nr:ABC transporter ATP-binding protein [Lachnospiraceae bacterium]
MGYNGKAVVDNININIKKGEIIALIGPNGAGKSTLLKSIARQLQVISGAIYLDGRNMKDYSFRELSTKMAVVLTDRLKVELMTCHDIVATGRYPYTGRLGTLSREDEDKVDEALATVQALDLGSRDFNAISDGQKQRVLLARAICQEPEIILLDEPTSFLDIKHKLELLSILVRMAREKDITVIASLHEIDLAEKVADRIISVKGSSIYRFGEPGEVFEENTIRELYDIDNGFFDPVFGSIELQKPSGDVPEVFVIAGNGSGIPVYRYLQKQNVPFATGILSGNDIDFRVARLLAAETVSTPAFTPAGDAEMERALELIGSCKRVINAGPPEGALNGYVKELLKAAEGKLEEF